MTPPQLLVVVGATAVGKTSLSIALAQALSGEIVSADSRLFYHGLNIGTAKPTPDEQKGIPHHLMDLCQLDQTFTLGEYQRQAYQTITEIHQRGKLPILVGGTGQYVWAVVEGWSIPELPPQPQLRELLAQLGGEELNRWLRHLDPARAAELDPRNVRRVIRALELILLTGKRMSDLLQKSPPAYQTLIIGLTADRDWLYRRIDARVDQMMADGLLAEVVALWGKYDRKVPALSGLGYQQLISYLAGETTLPQAIERIKFETHRFARQQNTWFRLDDPRIHWFNIQDQDTMPKILHLLRREAEEVRDEKPSFPATPSKP